MVLVKCPHCQKLLQVEPNLKIDLQIEKIDIEEPTKDKPIIK